MKSPSVGKRGSRLATLRPEDADQFRDMLTNSTMKLGTPGERCGENLERHGLKKRLNNKSISYGFLMI